MNKIWLAIRYFLRDRFSFAQDQDNETEIVEAIRKGVPFRGVNLWMLIFAKCQRPHCQDLCWFFFMASKALLAATIRRPLPIGA